MIHIALFTLKLHGVCFLLKGEFEGMVRLAMNVFNMSDSAPMKYDYGSIHALASNSPLHAMPAYSCTRACYI